MEPMRIRLQLERGTFALDVDLSLPGRGVTGLLGASGSGKTTLLRCVAGLERGARGELVVAGQVWQDTRAGTWLVPHRRPVGYVFQEANLFAHLSVRRNLDYGERRVAPAQRTVPREQAIELLGIGHLMERSPEHLSGGERQRVAIARALLAGPRVLLMDEPLAALDASRKAEILPFLERLHDELALPVLYVSHAVEEVARLADHVVLIEAGRVRASGGVTQALSQLDLPALWQDDAGSVIAATVAEHDVTYGLSRVAFRGGSLWVGHSGGPVGAAVRARVLARDVSVATQPPQGSSILNVLPARIAAMREDGGDTVLLRLVPVEAEDVGAVGGGGSNEAAAVLLARITRRSHDQLELQVGQAIYAQVKGVALMR